MLQTTRYEIKYRIPPQKGWAVESSLHSHMEPDAHGEGGSGSYHIHSLYLDGDDWTIYRDTRAGCFSRFKLRARTYSFDPDAPVFLEVKARKGESMKKTRVQTTREEASRVVWGSAPLLTPPSEGLDHFRTLQDLRRAVPKVWVTYRRDAFVGEDRLGLVRVTFDRDIAYAEPTFDLREPPRWFRLPEVQDVVILELKYHGSYPGWIADLIRRFDLDRKAMSKYKHAVDAHRAGERLAVDRWPAAGVECAL